MTRSLPNDRLKSSYRAFWGKVVVNMYYIIVNPASQSGKGLLASEKIKKYLEKKNIDAELHYTKKDEGFKSEFDSIAAKEKNTIRLIIVGGDGTLNYCINGISDFSRVEFSLLPIGSGNDFIRNKHLPKGLTKKIDRILSRQNIENVDIGQTFVKTPDGSNISRRFIVSSGVGYDAEICYNVDHSKLKKFLNKLHLGKLVYVLIGIKGIFTNVLSDLTVTLNNEVTEYKNSFFIAAMNQPCEGGGVPMAPAAVDTDGMLHFTLFYNMTHLKALFTIPAIYVKKHLRKKGVACLTGNEIDVKLSVPKMIHCDGECLGAFDNFHVILDERIAFVY